MGKWIVVLVIALCSGCPELAHEVAGMQDVPAETGGEEGDDAARDQAEGAGEGGGGVLDAGAADEPAEDGEPSGGGADPDGGVAEPDPLPTPWWDGVWQVSASPFGTCRFSGFVTVQQTWRIHAADFSEATVERETIDGDKLGALPAVEYPIGSDRWTVSTLESVDDTWKIRFDEPRRIFEGTLTLWNGKDNCWAELNAYGRRVGDHVQ